MAGEVLDNKRNFGVEIRGTDDRAEQRKLLREMIMEAASVDDDAARRVLYAFHDAQLEIITEGAAREGMDAISSLHRLQNIAHDLFPDSDTPPQT